LHPTTKREKWAQWMKLLFFSKNLAQGKTKRKFLLQITKAAKLRTNFCTNSSKTVQHLWSNSLSSSWSLWSQRLSSRIPGATPPPVILMAARSTAAFATSAASATWTACFSSSSWCQPSDTTCFASTTDSPKISKSTRVIKSMIICCTSSRS